MSEILEDLARVYCNVLRSWRVAVEGLQSLLSTLFVMDQRVKLITLPRSCTLSKHRSVYF